MFAIAPITGPWEWDGFPEVIEIDGIPFHKAVRRQPYKGVIEQYRQAVPRESMHLLVCDDGWIVEHVDDYNPDMGYPVRHFIHDHPIGKALIFTAGGIGAMALAWGRGKQSEAKRPNLRLVKRA